MRLIRPLTLTLAAILSTPALAGEGLTGQWSGSVHQPGFGDFSISMRLQGSTGGTIDYPSIGCGGKLRFLGRSGRSYTYREELDHGVDKCIDFGTVTVTPNGDSLAWTWSGGSLSLSSTLNGKRENPCQSIIEQLDKDKKAMQELSKSIGAGLAEIEALAIEIEKAESDALRIAVKALLGGLADKLQKRAAAASAFKGWMTRYEQQLRSKQVPFDVLLPKIERAVRGYTNAKVDVLAGKVLSSGLTAVDIWELVRTECGAIRAMLEDSDQAIASLKEDQQLRAYLSTDSPGSELAAQMVGLAASSEELGKFIGPHATLASFLVDTGFTWYAWNKKRTALSQQLRLSEDNLKAVESLKRQIERTVARLKQCRESQD